MRAFLNFDFDFQFNGRAKKLDWSDKLDESDKVERNDLADGLSETGVI
jgi:hypothetical protein